MKIKEGIASFKKASNEGYLVATYLLGLINLCSEDVNSKEVGYLMIPDTLIKMGLEGIVECRKKIRYHFSTIWIENKITIQSDLFVCYNNIKCELKRNLWEGANSFYIVSYEPIILCNACKCNRELLFFLSFMS